MLSLSEIVISLMIGLVAVWPLLWFVKRKNLEVQTRVLGLSLVIAALIYVVFALIWGNQQWFWIELTGAFVYALFCFMGIKYGIIWIGLGWLLHPSWDLLLHLYGPGHAVVPHWYAWACLSFDVAVFGFIMSVLYNQPRQLN